VAECAAHRRAQLTFLSLQLTFLSLKLLCLEWGRLTYTKNHNIVLAYMCTLHDSTGGGWGAIPGCVAQQRHTLEADL